MGISNLIPMPSPVLCQPHITVNANGGGLGRRLGIRAYHSEIECFDLAYNCNNQSSCVLVGQMALLCGTTP